MFNFSSTLRTVSNAINAEAAFTSIPAIFIPRKNRFILSKLSRIVEFLIADKSTIVAKCSAIIRLLLKYVFYKLSKVGLYNEPSVPTSLNISFACSIMQRFNKLRQLRRFRLH